MERRDDRKREEKKLTGLTKIEYGEIEETWKTYVAYHKRLLNYTEIVSSVSYKNVGGEEMKNKKLGRNAKSHIIFLFFREAGKQE